MNRFGAAPCQWSSPGLEEHAVTRADDLDRTAAALREADALEDEDRLAVRVRVPRRARARREVHPARRKARDV